ncbi:MAG: DNA primase [Myxococcales bacterium]|nr:DNA primase [Myxococcales bacterium]
MIGRETIDRIRSRVDIVAVVSETVKLTQRGRSWTGLCPFHQEKSPSFTVSPERGLFHCFGCKTSGDVFKFVELSEGLSFIEVLKKLAERAGVEIEDERGDHDRASEQRARKAKDDLYGINAIAAEYFGRMLHEHPLAGQARDELTRRGLPIDGPVVEAFGIGYAPHGWDGLAVHLQRQGVSPAQAEHVGLLAPRSSGSGYYDAFRHRLLVAIKDVQGRVVAFSGRMLPNPPGVADDGKGPPPKYVNSRESPIYAKGHTLFGLYQARAAIRTAQEAVVVEGNFDLVAMHARGIENVVAPMGTAFTEDQARLLRRFTQSVVLLFDADGAGMKATRVARQTLREATPTSQKPREDHLLALARQRQTTRVVGLQARCAQLPSGKDPDEFLRQRGPEAMRALLKAAPSLDEILVEDALDEVSNGSDVARKRRALEVVRPLLEDQEPTLREHLVQRVARRMGVDPAILWRALRGDISAVSTGPERTSRPAVPGAALSQDEETRSKAIGIALFSCPDVLDESDVQDCLALVVGDWAFAIAALRQEVRAAREENRVLDAASLIGAIPEAVREFCSAALIAQEDPVVARRTVRRDAAGLRKLVAEARHNDILREIERAEAEGDFDRALALALEKTRSAVSLRLAREQAAKEDGG